MIASLLLAAAMAQSPGPGTANATMGVSLRIVEACEPGSSTAACTADAYERWLLRHVSKRRLIAAEPQQATHEGPGGQVVEVVF